MTRFQLTGLWRHDDFLKLWSGQTISVFGSLVGGFALQLVAILVLNANAFQVALLGAARLVPGLLVGALAGVWVDRLRRRPIMIAADLGRTILLGSIPLAAILGVLRIEQLYVVALLVSVLTVFFDVAYQAYLPSLVDRDDLVEGNSKLQASSSIAEVAGFGLAGVLVEALTAPIAILVDALSFLVSAVSLAAIRSPEPALTIQRERQGTWREIEEGLRIVLRSATVRAIAGTVATRNFFGGFVGALIVLFLTRDLLVDPAVMGVVFGLGGISSFLGALVAERVTKGWDLGPTLLGTVLISGGATFFIPLAGGPFPLVLFCLGAQQLLGDWAATVHDIDRVSLLQAITPGLLQGRMHASMRLVEWGANLAGLLLGGALGDAIGLRPTLLLAATGLTLSALWLYFSPVRGLRGQLAPLSEAWSAEA